MIVATAALLLVTLALPAPAVAASGSGLAVATASAESLRLPPGSAGATVPLRLEALSGTLEFPSRNPAATARALAKKSALCPTVETTPSGVRLRCRTRRLAAAVVVDRRGPTLELRELRGIPWRAGEDGPPFLPWDPTVLGASPCPGTSPAARGECVLARGEVEEATRHFLEAMDGPERPWAAVRLGDLALSRDRLEEAIGWWKAAGSTGRFARLAAARLCELTGKCLEGRAFAGLFDPAGLPWPLDLELSLRASRVEAFLGRPGAAVSRILALPSPARAAACGWAKELCRRIALEGLREAEGADREEALAFYLSLPDYHRGPLAVELARSAAEVAKGLGAPVYAGSLLAMVAAAVPPAELAPHLLRAAELFVAGADPVRAAVILEYARTRLPPKELETAPWQRIVSAVAVAASPLAPVGPPAADPDLEYARQVLERARGGS